MNEAPFRTRTVTWVAVVAGVSFLLALALAVFGPELAPTGRTIGANAYSRSALGHAGLVDALEALDVPVLVSRSASARKALARGVLVLAEPEPGHEGGPGEPSRLRKLVDASEFTLLVLPKRSGREHDENPAWVGVPGLLPLEQVESVLAEAGIEANIRRVSAESVSPVMTRIGTSPTFAEGEVVQVVEGPGLWPLVTTNGGGTLLASVEMHPGLYLLADPDPLSNADFHRGDNVWFLLRALNHVRDGYESVVLDESIHGFGGAPTIWRELLHFPLVLVTIHLALLLGIVLWAGMGRFGTPRAPHPPLEPGTASLVERTVALLRHGATSRHALPRYLDVALRTVRRGLDAPPTLRDEALEAWLDRIAESRDVRERVGDLREAVSASRGHPHEVLEVARRIHRWRTEILHGAQ